MAEFCPGCGAAVDDEVMHCAACGAEINPFKTIRPPKFNAGAAPAFPARESNREPAPPRPPAEPPAPRPKPKVRRAAPAPAPAPDTVPNTAPPAPPPPLYKPAPSQAPAPPPPAPAAVAAPAAPAAPGRLRKKLIEWLGGKAEPPPAPPPVPSPLPPVWMEPDRSPAPPPPVAPYAPAPIPTVPRPEPPPAPPLGEVDDDGATRAMRGADLAKLKVPTHLFSLQILDKDGSWQPWSTIGAGGLKMGRGERNARFPELNSLASRHLKLSYDGKKLVAEDMGSLNGVYWKLTRPVALKNGSRFRVGARIIEFRTAEPLPEVEPLHAEDGEEFWSADLRPLAYLDFIRPNGERGLRFHVTNPDQVLGRESRPGKPVDVTLPEDDWVSGQHAQVRREGDQFFLEDLRSRNGTFVRVDDPTEVVSGDILLVGRVLLRVVDASGR